MPQRQQRKPLTGRAHVVRGTGEVVEVEMCDLSYDGCKVATPTYFWLREQLKLSVPRRGAIDCEVRWCTDGFAGLRFEPDHVPEVPTVDRIEPRVAAAGEVQLRRLGSTSYRVDIHDLSRFGCRVELVERPRVGEVMLVRFDGLEALDSRVKWVEGFVAGLQFERPIHVAVFDILKDRLREQG